MLGWEGLERRTIEGDDEDELGRITEGFELIRDVVPVLFIGILTGA